MNDNSAKSRVYIFSVSKEKYKLSSATNSANSQRRKEKRLYKIVLVLGGIEVIFSLMAGTVLHFEFRMRIMLVAH